MTKAERKAYFAAQNVLLLATTEEEAALNAAAMAAERGRSAAASAAAAEEAEDDSASSASPSIRTRVRHSSQTAVNQMWATLRREVGHLRTHGQVVAKYGQLHAKAKSDADDDRQRTQRSERPTIAKSILDPKKWESRQSVIFNTPKEPKVELSAEEQKKVDDEAIAADAAETMAASQYTGSKTLSHHDESTVWDKRYEALRRQLRTFMVVGPRRLVRAASARSEKFKQAADAAKEEIDQAKEQWETSQNPNVWRAKNMVDAVVGQSETGAAFGEMMQVRNEEEREGRKERRKEGKERGKESARETREEVHLRRRMHNTGLSTVSMDRRSLM